MSTPNDTVWDIVRICWLTPNAEGYWGQAVHIQSPPGLGKSYITSSLARRMGLGIYTTYGSSIRPEDIPGLPVITNPGHEDHHAYTRTVLGLGEHEELTRTKYTIPEMVWKAMERPTVLFFDEATGAPPDVQQAMLGVIQAHHCGPHRLPPSTRILLASNPARSVGGHDLTHAMANRLAWLVLDVDHNGWLDWLSGHSPNISDEVLAFEAPAQTIEDQQNAVLAAWPRHWPTMKGAFVGFIRARGGAMLHSEPQAAKDRIGPWPSPRSVTNALHTATTAHCLGRKDLTTAVIRSLVGEGWAKEFAAWLSDAGLPDPEAVLEGNEMVMFTAGRPDRSMAIVEALTEAIRYNPGEVNGRRATNYWFTLSQLVPLAPDIVNRAARTVWATGDKASMVLRASEGSRGVVREDIMLDKARKSFNK